MLLCCWRTVDMLHRLPPLLPSCPLGPPHPTPQLMRPNSLVQHHLNGRDPSYLVVAGIVFTVVTGALLVVFALLALLFSKAPTTS